MAGLETDVFIVRKHSWSEFLHTAGPLKWRQPSVERWRKFDSATLWSSLSVSCGWEPPKSAIGNTNSHHPIRWNGGDVSCWAALQPLTPAPPSPTPAPHLSPTLSSSLYIFQRRLSCCTPSPVFHSRPSLMSGCHSPPPFFFSPRWLHTLLLQLWSSSSSSGGV